MTAPDPIQDVGYLVPRHLLEKYFGRDPRLMRAFELQAEVVAGHDEVLQQSVAATGALQDATVVTLSANAALNNEYILIPGDGTKMTIGSGSLSVDVDSTVARVSGPPVAFSTPVGGTLGLPTKGTLLSNVELGALSNCVDDTAAAAAGVPIGGLYHNAGALRVRLV